MTWILPKQLHTSAFVADTKALDLDSEEFSQICEKSLTWRGKDSLSRTWLQRWKRESWMQHLCSRTLRPSHTTSFLDKWTSYLEDSLVSPSQLLESVKQLKIQDTSFLPSPEESKPVNLELCFSKTSKESSPAKQPTESQFSSMSSEHWKKWITEQRQEYSQRKKLAHLIRESESSSWATPRAGNPGSRPNGKGGKVLAEQAQQSWPTASVAGCVEGGVAKNVEMTPSGFKATRENGTSYGAKLRDAVIHHEEQKNWVSPTASQAEKPQGPNSQQKGLQSQVRKEGVETHEKNWATPEAQNHTGYQTKNGQVFPRLGSQVKNWATPNTMDVLPVRTPEKLAKAKQKGGCKNLREEVMQPQNWPTASARDWKDTAGMSTERDGKALGRVDQLPRAVYHYEGLQDQANLNTSGKNLESWMTPRVLEVDEDYENYQKRMQESGNPKNVGKKKPANLTMQAKNQESWPTPRANKVHPQITEENREQLANRNKANLEEDIAGHCGKATGKLNPNWVEQLMGLPVGWTDLGYWETASFH